MLQEIYVLPKRIIEKWNNLVPNHDYDWSDIFYVDFKCAIDSKTRNFLFKFLHRIIAIIDFLYKLQIIESNLCTFCSKNIDSTLEHVSRVLFCFVLFCFFFYDCDIIIFFVGNRVVAVVWIKEKVGSGGLVTRENIFPGLQCK